MGLQTFNGSVDICTFEVKLFLFVSVHLSEQFLPVNFIHFFTEQVMLAFALVS